MKDVVQDAPESWLKTSPMRHGALLGLFSLAAALILSASYTLTAETIALRMSEDRMASLAQVIPASLHNNDVSKTTVEVEDALEGKVAIHLATRDTAVTAAALELTAFGYAGAIQVLIGIAPDGHVLGVRVLSHAETPGLGDKIERRKEGDDQQ